MRSLRRAASDAAAAVEETGQNLSVTAATALIAVLGVCLLVLGAVVVVMIRTS